MSDAELVKAGAEAALKPFADLIARLFGGPTDELGGMMQDSLRARRIIRQVKLYKKVKAVIEEAGFEPQQIRDKIWMPALQAASMEDDEFLQDQWAGLLANASNPATAANIQSSFPAILSTLSKADAVFLNAIYEQVNFHLAEDYPPRLWNSRFAEQLELGDCNRLVFIYAAAGLTTNEASDLVALGSKATSRVTEDLIGFDIARRNLLRQQLLSSRLKLKGSDTISDVTKIFQEEVYFMTVLGYEFVTACRMPVKTPL